jgi:endonuclease/exonuclease/phosphatase family metal-dependent hydrolase
MEEVYQTSGYCALKFDCFDDKVIRIQQLHKEDLLLNVLTLNTWQKRGPWQDRWQLIFEGIESLKPHLIGFQELFDPAWTLEVQKKLPLKNMVSTREKGGLALYSAFPVLESGFVRLEQSPLEDYERYALWAKIRIGNMPVFVVNTHLSWKLEDGGTRQQQVLQLIELIEQKGAGHELLLMGDHNATPDSPEMTSLRKKARLTDLYGRVESGLQRYTWDNRNTYASECNHPMPDRRIDYILTRSQSMLEQRLTKCAIVFMEANNQGVWASDHFGVWTQFEVNV